MTLCALFKMSQNEMRCSLCSRGMGTAVETLNVGDGLQLNARLVMLRYRNSYDMASFTEIM